MSRLKNIRLPVSANLKLMLVLLALTIVASTLWFTQGLVGELKEAEQRTLQFYATTLETLLNSPQENNVSSEITSDLALKTADILYFPTVVTDPDGNPTANPVVDSAGNVQTEWIAKNIDVDRSLPLEQQEEELRAYVNQMASKYEPLRINSITQYTEQVGSGQSAETVEMFDTTHIMNVYYDDSTAIKQLQLLPWIELILISMFVLIGYISFSHIKRSEQSNIWVGMAKETAHQLGTPLSSLMGWIELLRFDPENREQVLEAADEMDRDVQRLNMVAQRFSKIGSASELKRIDLREVIGAVIVYFERRLPHLGKRVTLDFDPPDSPMFAKVNVELLQWVFENLIRNAADAIERNPGEIRFSLYRSRHSIVIDVSDNGKGIDPKIRKDIFRPGFSTKQRGWGLGLSLAKRIIQEYHGGKIYIKDSSPQGTTFTIRLIEAFAEPDPTTENGVGYTVRTREQIRDSSMANEEGWGERSS